MSLISTIEADLTSGMKSGNGDLVAVLRLLKNSLKNEQIKLGHELGEDEALKVVQREAKQRRDSIAAYSQAERPELVAAEEAELRVIEGYLPQQLSEAELAELVDVVVAETGVTDASQMGMVMGKVIARVAGRADGGEVSRIVRQRLAG